MPKHQAITKDLILNAAIHIIRQEGGKNLSARKIASQLGSSVAPIYSCFSSMEELFLACQREIIVRLDSLGKRRFTDHVFLNRGIGFVVFARDEANLLRFLFENNSPPTHTRGRLWVENYKNSILAELPLDSIYSTLDETKKKSIVEWLWVTTLGLVFVQLHGLQGWTSTEDIARNLLEQGGVQIFGIIANLRDSSDPVARQTWLELGQRYNLPKEALSSPIMVNPAVCGEYDREQVTPEGYPIRRKE